MHAFESVAEGANNGSKIFEDKASEAHSNSFHESCRTAVSCTGVRLYYESCDSIVDSKDELLPSGPEARFHTCYSSRSTVLSMSVNRWVIEKMSYRRTVESP